MNRKSRLPTIDKRLSLTCQRIRALADQVEERWRYGMVHLFTEEHVIQSHRHWKVEVPVPELEDYQHAPEGGEEVPLPPSIPELCDMLRRVIEGCKGVRGIESPAAPTPELLYEVVELLRREPHG
jgi:hypothetical protein